ncbi:mannosyltransferase [Scheffersomyces coipomensis]|uniref:mannosyltransferase n=1 Tax=Scheffersomyces coipomensis TaxID=1788519 RepID=UPI00315DD859
MPFLTMPRPKQKFVVYSAVIVWLVVINVWIYRYYMNQDSEMYKTIISNEDSFYPIHHKPESTDKDNKDNKDNQKSSTPNKKLHENISFQIYLKQMGVSDIRDITPIHSTIYDQIFENHDVNSVLGNLDFNQRCQLYFNNLYYTDHNWMIDPNKHLPADSLREFTFQRWRQSKFNSLRDDYIKDNDIKLEKVEDFNEDEKFENVVRAKYKEFWDQTLRVEQEVMDYLTHLRIFNKCFIQNDDTNSQSYYPSSSDSKFSTFVNEQAKFLKSFISIETKQKIPKFEPTRFEKNLETLNMFENCNNLEKRSYPWLSFNYPVYEKWDGSTFIEPPKLTPPSFGSSIFDFKIGSSKQYNCFLNDFKKKANGRGIVLSINDGHVDDTIHLIHSLRALNNELPIQIVFYDSLSPESKQRVVNAAREDFFTLPDSFLKVKHNFPDDYLIDGLPKQDIWFVNVYSILNDQYRKKFSKFGNKFLATLFNSFEEFILVDADTVLLQNPKSFFELKGYKDTGAYFFKDRSTQETRPDSDSYFVKKVSPSVIDHALFDIKMITKKTTSFAFFEGLNHFMESGVVMLDRTRHYTSMLLLPELHFMDPVRSRSWGDKELFWMAFVFNGDENFAFNSLFAASAGIVSEPRKKKDGTFERSRELCSAHPAHINGEDEKTLLWINSGFKYCGQAERVNYKEEVEKKERRYAAFNTETELRRYYSNPLEITHAVVPPFKSRAELHCPNEDNEPGSGWDKTNLCKGYVWCAHSSIGGRTRRGQDNTQLGHLIEFTEEQTDMFKFYGDVWVGLE